MNDKLPIICLICGKEAEVEQTFKNAYPYLDLICEECKADTQKK